MLKYKFIGLFLFVFSSFVNAQNCNKVPSQLKKLITPDNILLFGEMHGTKEMPENFFDVICVASESEKQINIGIEAPSELTKDIQSFIHTSNNSDLNMEFLKHKFWSGEHQDGRASQAMLVLIKKIRTLNLINKNIDIFTFDHEVPKRDKLMASTFKANIDPTKVTLALTGNIHSMTAHGRPWNKQEKNMGAFIKEKFSNTHSIYFSYSGGDGWVCMPSCGVHSFGEEQTEVSRKFIKSDGSNNHMWNWEIGNVKASLPARKVIKTSNKKINRDT